MHSEKEHVEVNSVSAVIMVNVAVFQVFCFCLCQVFNVYERSSITYCVQVEKALQWYIGEGFSAVLNCTECF